MTIIFSGVQVDVSDFTVPPASTFIRGYMEEITFSVRIQNNATDLTIEAVNGDRQNFNISLYASDTDVRTHGVGTHYLFMETTVGTGVRFITLHNSYNCHLKHTASNCTKVIGLGSGNYLWRVVCV